MSEKILEKRIVDDYLTAATTDLAGESFAYTPLDAGDVADLCESHEALRELLREGSEAYYQKWHWLEALHAWAKKVRAELEGGPDGRE